MNSIKKQITNNLMLKGIAGMLGVLCWLKYSHDTPVHCWIRLPVSFYNTSEDQKINAPEQIHAHIRGKRTDLYLLDASKCAIHLDAQHLAAGINKVHITPGDICLPEAVTMVNYSPLPVSVKIE